MVGTSLIVAIISSTGEVTTLRLVRAFRVLRLFGKLRSLRLIVNALMHSLVPVISAFFVMILVIAIYSIVGSSLFGEEQPDKFGTFSRALFTMFQVSRAF